MWSWRRSIITFHEKLIDAWYRYRVIGFFYGAVYTRVVYAFPFLSCRVGVIKNKINQSYVCHVRVWWSRVNVQMTTVYTTSFLSCSVRDATIRCDSATLCVMKFGVVFLTARLHLYARPNFRKHGGHMRDIVCGFYDWRPPWKFGVVDRQHPARRSAYFHIQGQRVVILYLHYFCFVDKISLIFVIVQH